MERCSAQILQIFTMDHPLPPPSKSFTREPEPLGAVATAVAQHQCWSVIIIIITRLRAFVVTAAVIPRKAERATDPAVCVSPAEEAAPE